MKLLSSWLLGRFFFLVQVVLLVTCYLSDVKLLFPIKQVLLRKIQKESELNLFKRWAKESRN